MGRNGVTSTFPPDLKQAISQGRCGYARLTFIATVLVKSMAASSKIATSTLSSGAEISSDFSKVTLHSRRALYVGGLADDVTEEMLRAAFLPFGPLKSVEMPRDYTKGTFNRGFGFVEFECPDDAEEAIFNMDGAEIMGKAITVNLAQPDQQYKLGSAKPIWSTDEWFKEQQQPLDGDSNKPSSENDALTQKVLADRKMKE